MNEQKYKNSLQIPSDEVSKFVLANIHGASASWKRKWGYVHWFLRVGLFSWDNEVSDFNASKPFRTIT